MSEVMSSEETYTLYIHTCIANKKVYVGITYKTAEDRWKDGEGYKSNFELYSDIRKYGWEEGFFHQIVSDGLSWEQVKEAEAFFIKTYDSTNPEKGYNHSIGGIYGKKKQKSDLGIRIKKLRKSNKLTQEELSKVINVSRSTLSCYEAGIRTPGIDELKLIAEHLGVGLDYFSDFTPDEGINLSARVLSFYQSENYTLEQKINLFNDIIGYYSRFVINVK